MKRHEILGLLFVSSVASAQVGTNLSGAATADGASPFLNPAAMALEEGTYGGISMGVSLIRLHYEPDDELGASDAFVPKPEPELGIVTDLPGNQWRLGFAFTVPITDGSIWPRDGGAADITRWYVVNGKVFHLAMTPAISFQPWSWLSVGAGVDVIYSRLSADLDKDFGIAFNQAAGSSSIDTPFPYGSDDFAGAVELRASGWNATPVFGILAQPHRMVRIGAGLHLGATTSATGTAKSTYPEKVAEVLKQAVPAADLPALEGKVAIPLALPTILNVAIVFTPGPRWELQANYLYIDDSVTSTLQISVLEATSPEVDDQSSIMAHADSHTYGLRVSRIFGAESRPAAKAGLFVEYEPNAIPDSTFSPVHMGFEKWEIGIGASVRLTNRLNLTLDYSHFILPERRVTDSLHRPLTNPALEAFNHPSPNGLYRAGADRIGVGIAFDI